MNKLYWALGLALTSLSFSASVGVNAQSSKNIENNGICPVSTNEGESSWEQNSSWESSWQQNSSWNSSDINSSGVKNDCQNENQEVSPSSQNNIQWGVDPSSQNGLPSEVWQSPPNNNSPSGVPWGTVNNPTDYPSCMYGGYCAPGIAEMWQGQQQHGNNNNDYQNFVQQQIQQHQNSITMPNSVDFQNQYQNQIPNFQHQMPYGSGYTPNFQHQMTMPGKF